MTPIQIVLVWPIIILTKCVWDWFQIVRLKKSPNHTVEFILMCIVAFLYSVAAGIRSIGQSELFGLITMYQFFSYVLLHDLLINIFRGMHPLYIGRTSWIDKNVWSRWPNFYTWSKIIALIFVIVSIKWIYEEML